MRDPDTGRDVVSSGMLQGLSARDGLVQFALAVPRSVPGRWSRCARRRSGRRRRCRACSPPPAC
ncbi:iron-sulfur cluster assembly protein [Pseudoroseomonas wenyumeiae]